LGKAYNEYKQGEPALERIFDLMRFNPEVLTYHYLFFHTSLILPFWLNYKNDLEQVISILVYFQKKKNMHVIFHYFRLGKMKEWLYISFGSGETARRTQKITGILLKLIQHFIF